MIKEQDILHELDHEAKKAKMVFRAYNNKIRKSIIKLMQKRNRPMMVTEIYKSLGIEQSLASQHLAILRRQGLVTPEREGKIIWYSLNKDAFITLLNFSKELNKVFVSTSLPTHKKK